MLPASHVLEPCAGDGGVRGSTGCCIERMIVNDPAPFLQPQRGWGRPYQLDLPNAEAGGGPTAGGSEPAGAETRDVVMFVSHLQTRVAILQRVAESLPAAELANSKS